LYHPPAGSQEIDNARYTSFGYRQSRVRALVPPMITGHGRG
jgi:hypothetical protein